MLKFIYKIFMCFMFTCGILYIKDSGWIDVKWIEKQIHVNEIYEYFNSKITPSTNTSFGISTKIPSNLTNGDE